MKIGTNLSKNNKTSLYIINIERGVKIDQRISPQKKSRNTTEGENHT